MADHGEKATLALASDSSIGIEQTHNWQCVQYGNVVFRASLYMLGEQYLGTIQDYSVYLT